MKKAYITLYITGLSVYLISFIYYTFNVIDKRLIHEVSYVKRIDVDVRGGRTKYDQYFLVDKAYYLSRSKAVFGSILSRKEISQFNVEEINRKKNEYEMYLNPSGSQVQISYFIDKEGVDKNPYVPIGLRIGNENIKDFWYYLSLLGYVMKHVLFFLILLGGVTLLGVKILLAGGNSSIVSFLCSLSLLIAISAVTIF